jgi:hypothetical protein
VALHDDVALDGFTERDPAERSAFNRLFYRNRRPTWLGHWVSQFFCWWARVGLTPHAWIALHVRDRVSGRWRQDAVVLPSVAGERYVVSMFGAISDWVNNIEAAHGDAAISHGGRQRVRTSQRAIPKCSFTLATICGSVSLSVVSTPMLRSECALERPSRSLSSSLASPGPRIKSSSASVS